MTLANWIKSAWINFWAWIKSVWAWCVHFFEYGDLVPLLVLVSAVHYAAVLAGKDEWPVAISIGMLVDLGHFRTVRAAFRYPGAKAKRVRKLSEKARWYSHVAHWFDERTRRTNGQLVARWTIALVMTGISLAYHQRYYGDWWLSAPLPFLIAALAWLQKVDANVGTKRPASNTGKSETVPQVVVSYKFNCEKHGIHTNNQRAWAGHMKKCKRDAVLLPLTEHSNGKSQ